MPHSRPLTFSHLLGTVALAPTVFGLAVIMAMATAHAATDDSETRTIVLRHVTAPSGPAAERHLRYRIERAALTVCGGGNGALAEIDRVIRNGPCWRDAVTRANAQIVR